MHVSMLMQMAADGMGDRIAMGSLDGDCSMAELAERGGENLSPGEFEEVILEVPGVLEAAVVGIPDTEWGEKIVAAIVVEAGATIDETTLKGHVKAKLRSTKTPEHIEVRTELPYNETGKLLRRVLRAELAASFGSGG